jgi:hydrogenase nickel incorporation protein HypA/HybF
MHEMSIARNIIETVTEAVPPEGREKVRKIHLKIGTMAGVVADSLTFCFDVIKSDSGLANSVIEVEQVEITCLCRSCGKLSGLEYGLFICPSCGGNDIELKSGNELNLTHIEVDE